MLNQKWNNKKIKLFKGRMIRIIYKSKFSEDNRTGIINASTDKQILFSINKTSTEICIKHEDIIAIKELK